MKASELDFGLRLPLDAPLWWGARAIFTHGSSYTGNRCIGSRGHHGAGHALAVWQRQADGTWLIRAWSAKYDPKP